MEGEVGAVEESLGWERWAAMFAQVGEGQWVQRFGGQALDVCVGHGGCLDATPAALRTHGGAESMASGV